MQCRVGCGACCIAPSISSPIPLMPQGKPAGARCVQLTAQNTCALFGKPERPKVCVDFKATQEFCGENTDQALRFLSELENQTKVCGA